jgi:hypothetical protein
MPKTNPLSATSEKNNLQLHHTQQIPTVPLCSCNSTTSGKPEPLSLQSHSGVPTLINRPVIQRKTRWLHGVSGWPSLSPSVGPTKLVNQRRPTGFGHEKSVTWAERYRNNVL